MKLAVPIDAAVNIVCRRDSLNFCQVVAFEIENIMPIMRAIYAPGRAPLDKYQLRLVVDVTRGLMNLECELLELLDCCIRSKDIEKPSVVGNKVCLIDVLITGATLEQLCVTNPTLTSKPPSRRRHWQQKAHQS